jgi:hypothetical protein
MALVSPATQDYRLSSGKLDSMTDSMFDLSLVICTRNRATQLGQTLKSVSTIRSLLKWELVVVDNGSTGRTSDVVAEYAATCDHPVQMIVEQGECPARKIPVGNRPNLASSFVSTMTVIRHRITSIQYSSASPMIQNLVLWEGGFCYMIRLTAE